MLRTSTVDLSSSVPLSTMGPWQPSFALSLGALFNAERCKAIPIGPCGTGLQPDRSPRGSGRPTGWSRVRFKARALDLDPERPSAGIRGVSPISRPNRRKTLASSRIAFLVIPLRSGEGWGREGGARPRKHRFNNCDTRGKHRAHNLSSATKGISSPSPRRGTEPAGDRVRVQGGTRS